MKPAAVKTKFLQPYRTEKGKQRPNLPHLREGKQAGVYLIKSKRSDKIIYVGYSETQLYKTIYRHFQEWNDRNQDRFTYNKTGYLVRIIFTTPGRAAILEKYLIKKLKPRDNKDKQFINITAASAAQGERIYSDSPFIASDDDCPF